ncbi:MAG: Rossmann-like domain-containing protein [Burkholderiales bacterium]
MSFATDYLAQLQAFAAQDPLPRVRALHLPPGRYAQDNRGEFCALELEDGSIGLSYVLLDDTLERLLDGADSFGLAGADALALARRYVDDSGIWKTLGFAAANALTRCLYDRAGFRPELSSDSIGHLNPQPGERIGMIGMFTPLLRRITASGARLTIIELKPELAGEHEGYRVTLDAEELSGCSKVVSTSTLLLNDTLDRMLACCRNARWFAMVGPSAGCLPDALFARGVTLLGGSWIEDRDGFTAALRRGASLSDHASKFALTADGYPGFEALLARAAGVRN